MSLVPVWGFDTLRNVDLGLKLPFEGVVKTGSLVQPADHVLPASIWCA